MQAGWIFYLSGEDRQATAWLIGLAPSLCLSSLYVVTDEPSHALDVAERSVPLTFKIEKDLDSLKATSAFKTLRIHASEELPEVPPLRWHVLVAGWRTGMNLPGTPGELGSVCVTGTDPRDCGRNEEEEAEVDELDLACETLRFFPAKRWGISLTAAELSRSYSRLTLLEDILPFYVALLTDDAELRMVPRNSRPLVTKRRVRLLTEIEAVPDDHVEPLLDEDKEAAAAEVDALGWAHRGGATALATSFLQARGLMRRVERAEGDGLEAKILNRLVTTSGKLMGHGVTNALDLLLLLVQEPDPDEGAVESYLSDPDPDRFSRMERIGMVDSV